MTDSSTTQQVRHYALYLYAESPVRAGGDKDAHVDLPMQRDSVTGFPVIHGSTLKGALRQHVARHLPHAPEVVVSLFGSDLGQARTTTPGQVGVGEAHVVALPMPTSARVFAWVTCPPAMWRVERTRSRAGLAPLGVPALAGDAFAHADPAGDSPYSRSVMLGPIVVEAGSLAADPAAAAWAQSIAAEAMPETSEVLGPFRDKFASDLIVAGSSVGGHLLRRATVEIIRNRIGDVTVPFDDEYLPEESVLVAPVTLPATIEATGQSPVTASDIESVLHGKVLQVGADRSVGKGLMWMSLVRQEPRP